jgi:hyperosmotically inducible periplasmic protein
MYRTVKKIGFAVLGLALTVGTAQAGAPSDAWITTKAKLALLTTEGVSVTDVKVDTVKGAVTLHGKVETAAEKDKAAAVVSKIDGAKSVDNLLQVVPARKEDAVQASDDQIKQQIADALGKDKSLADSNIDVQSVNAGVALLGGTATSLTDQLRAVEIAADVRGVRRVVSEVQGPEDVAINVH